MDCPNCSKKVREVEGRKKHERVPVLRRFRGGIKIIGRYGCTDRQLTCGASPPEGAIIVEKCRSCGWMSIHRHDGEMVNCNENRVAILWRLLDCGMTVNVNKWLSKYGYKR